MFGKKDPNLTPEEKEQKKRRYLSNKEARRQYNKALNDAQGKKAIPPPQIGKSA